MAKVNAPLLSFGAGGTVAKTQVYSKWKGRPYVRQHVIPSNPNSADQQLTRNTFSWLNQVWKNAPSLLQDPWDLYAQGQVLTGRNAFVGQNTRVLRSQTDLAAMIFSPGAKGGIIAANVVTTPGAGQLSVAITAPALPTGWTITQGIAVAIRDQDPQTEILYSVASGFDATDPYAVVLTGLTASELYRVGAWFEYAKPDGSTAYGASFLSSGTPS